MGYRFAADVRTVSGPEYHSDAPVVSAAAPTTAVLSATNTKRWIPFLTVALLLIVLISIFVFRPRPTEGVKPTPAAAVPLTAYQGFENAPSLSPDGSQVAFSWNGPTLDNFDIYVKLVGPGEPIPVTKNPARDDNPSWSPDGKLIAFERFTAPNRADAVRRSGTWRWRTESSRRCDLGVEIRNAERIERNLSWSPDGKWLGAPRRCNRKRNLADCCGWVRQPSPDPNRI